MAINTVSLPIDPLLPEIVQAVQNNPITLLQAEPGAGKTTRVPAALLAAGLNDVYVLEPRRLAARMAARRVAEEMGERIGETIGYQVRFEHVGGADTRLWFVTEGVLTRKLLDEHGVGRARVVILDEFHERHLETDIALALLRRLQTRRSDLRLLIMSATLRSEILMAALGNAELITAPGKLYPVAVRYTPTSSTPLEEQVATAVEAALAETNGHVLVFLPGAAEIRRALQACDGIAKRANARLLPLHGELPPDQQDTAVAPSSQRKIICATNAAESSITIEGVTAVVDSGLARVLTHSQWSGFSRLQVSKISKSSAMQRAGRAGRTSAGAAIRLYGEADFERRPAEISPEILRADLTQMFLLLVANGIAWDDLPWLDAPSEEMRLQAQELLVRLEALDDSGAVTPVGRKMSRLAVHPRLARFVLSAAEAGHGHDAYKLAAVLSEGRLRVEDAGRGAFASDIDALLAADLSYAASRLARQLADDLPRNLARSDDPTALEKAFLRAFPDRVAKKRGETLLLSTGSAAQLDRASHVHGDFLMAIEVDDRSDRSMPLVRLASVIEPDWLLEFFADHITTSEEMVWNRDSERVEQVNALLYDRLTIDESRSAPSNRDAASALLAAKVLEAGIERFVDAKELDRLMNRVEFAARASGIRVSDDVIAASVAELAAGIYSFTDFRNAAGDGLVRALQSKLPMRQIDEVAPEFIRLPSGRRARIEYHRDRSPSVASRLQDFFGMLETPSVAHGSVPLVVHLLAPNQRPVQVTTDLVSFWKNLYPQVRRELSRRYPKHRWPEIPA